MNNDYLKILTFLQNVDSDFPIPLSEKQNLHKYARKIMEYATVCTIEADGDIVAAAIGYTERLIDQLAYIAVVATIADYRGRGFAEQCVRDFIEICKEKNIHAVHLYAVSSNIPAIRMYKKIGFCPYILENEPRPQDVHLIYKVSHIAAV